MSENRPVRIGIVGTGHRGNTLVMELVKVPGVKLTALCDINPARMEVFNQRFKLDDAVKATSVDQILKGDLVDAVIVTVPDSQHAPVAVACFRAGKDVLVEKPLGATTAQCRSIVEAHKASGRVMQIGFNMRCHSFYKKVKEVVDSGRLGRIMHVHANEFCAVHHGASFMTRWHRKKENTGSFIVSKCSHDLDMLNWMIGAKPTHVASFGDNDYFRPSRAPAKYCCQCPEEKTCRFKLPDIYHHIEGEPPAPGRTDMCVFNDDKDVVDNQVIILEYANRVRATFELQLFHPVGLRTITIAGENAYLWGDTVEKIVHIKYSTDERVEDIDASANDGSSHDGSDGTLVTGFVEAVRTRRNDRAGAEEGLAANVIADAIELARMEKRVVTIDPGEYEL